MQVRNARKILATTAVATLVLAWSGPPPTAVAEPVTFTGTVSYEGTYAGDTLYVAVLDTVGVEEDVTILDIQAIAASAPPFMEPYALTFDNAGVATEVLIASFLDTDGGGVGDVGGADVFGWYGEGTMPVGISSASSQSGLDFSLPLGEIRGTITFAAEMDDARLDVSQDIACLQEGFRPGAIVTASGPYAVIGVYPGTYCVSAEGSGPSFYARLCYGDPTCVSPTPVTVTEGEVVTGIDLDFTTVPVEESSWGGVKALFR